MRRRVAAQKPPLRWTMVRSPCGPSRISEKKEMIATHTIGVMSTPATGGMNLRVPLRIVSVGHAAMLYGKAFRSYLADRCGVSERGEADGGEGVAAPPRRRSCACASGAGGAHFGNQERTVRKRKRSVKMVKTGLSTNLAGPTQLTSPAPAIGTSDMAAAAPSSHVSAVANGGSAAEGRSAWQDRAGCGAGARAVLTGLTALGGSRTAAQSESEHRRGRAAVGIARAGQKNKTESFL